VFVFSSVGIRRRYRAPVIQTFSRAETLPIWWPVRGPKQGCSPSAQGGWCLGRYLNKPHAQSPHMYPRAIGFLWCRQSTADEQSSSVCPRARPGAMGATETIPGNHRDRRRIRRRIQVCINRCHSLPPFLPHSLTHSLTWPQFALWERSLQLCVSLGWVGEGVVSLTRHMGACA